MRQLPFGLKRDRDLDARSLRYTWLLHAELVMIQFHCSHNATFSQAPQRELLAHSTMSWGKRLAVADGRAAVPEHSHCSPQGPPIALLELPGHRFVYPQTFQKCICSISPVERQSAKGLALSQHDICLVRWTAALPHVGRTLGALNIKFHLDTECIQVTSSVSHIVGTVEKCSGKALHWVTVCY